MAREPELVNRIGTLYEKVPKFMIKDENGEYVARGNRNIKINGENFKPLLADAVSKLDDVTVINQLNITDYLVNNNKIEGAVGFSIADGTAYEIRAKKVLIATGGAAGLYRPNNPGFSRHKMWYPPFNTGAGYAMGILAGAEMTTFEMRFIALRCKDTIAPTGTIAQGVGAKQINSLGEVYETKYGITTEERVYGTVAENQEGRGPCYLHTEGIKEEQGKDLLKAYLNMAPSQTLKWIESGKEPNEQDVEIEGTEPYIVGGHTASGYWIDDARRTTLKGLYAAGDVAGGCPQKYVTGALVEGEIAAETILKDLKQEEEGQQSEGQASKEQLEKLAQAVDQEYESCFAEKKSFFGTEQIEEAMQKVMDAYAGGIGTNYRYNEKQLNIAEEKIDQLFALTKDLTAKDTDDLLHIYEVKERLVVCKSVIAHLKARKETRWRGFGQNMDYPGTKDDWDKKAVNSVYENGKIKILFRDLTQTPDFGQKGGTL